MNSKHIDFAKQRRDHGRALDSSIRELMEMLPRDAEIDYRAVLSLAREQKARERQKLAERLQKSVVPLFVSGARGRPSGLGTCVLVRLDSKLCAFTAAHVIRGAGPSPLWAPSLENDGRLEQLPTWKAYLSPKQGHNDLDVAVLALHLDALGPFQGRVFLSGEDVDAKDQPDQQSFDSFHFVLGYPASNRQMKSAAHQITAVSFHCATSTVDAAEYAQEQMPQSDHVLLDYDHEEIFLKDEKVNPPRLQGVSGGGIFRVSRNTMEGPLVAIATENRRGSRLIAGTRIKHFLTMAATYSDQAR